MGEVQCSGVTVRAVLLGAPGRAELTLLAPAELRRGERFVSAAAADEFLSGRIALRLFAAELAGVGPEALDAVYRCRVCGAGNPDHGQPHYRLRDGTPGPLLSLSRAGGRAVLAGGWSRDGLTGLGVDAEVVERTDFPGFDGLALTPRERLLVAGAAKADAGAGAQRARFWVRKEAFLKATGSGLSRDPASVDVSGAVLEGVELTDLDPGELGLPGSVVVALAVAVATSRA